MSNYILNPELEADYRHHMRRLISDPAYAKWQETFRYHWQVQNWHSLGNIPHAFIIEMYDHGYSAEDAFELFKIADAESYARRREMEEIESQSFTMSFSMACRYLKSIGYDINPFPVNEDKHFVESTEHIYTATKHEIVRHAMEMKGKCGGGR